MDIRVLDACRLDDESDSEPPFAHQTSLILSDTRWLRIARPTASTATGSPRAKAGRCPCCRQGEEQTWSSGFSGRWRYWRTATRSRSAARSSAPCSPPCCCTPTRSYPATAHRRALGCFTSRHRPSRAPGVRLPAAQGLGRDLILSRCPSLEGDVVTRVVREGKRGRRLAFLDHLRCLPLGRVRAMVAVHVALGVAVIAVCIGGAILGFVAYRRGVGTAGFVAHGLVLAQTLLIAQAALGLLLLSDDRRAPDRLHYTYGALALGLALTPWFYAPRLGQKRLLWFAVTTSSPARSRCAHS